MVLNLKGLHALLWFEHHNQVYPPPYLVWSRDLRNRSHSAISLCASLFCNKCTFNIDLCAYSTQQHLCYQYTLSCRVELLKEFIFHWNCFNNCMRAHTLGKCPSILLHSDEQRAVNGYWKSLQMRTFSAGYCVFQSTWNWHQMERRGVEKRGVDDNEGNH